MKGVPKTVTVVGKPGIGTGAPGKLIVAVTGCGGTRIPSKGKCFTPVAMVPAQTTGGTAHKRRERIGTIYRSARHMCQYP